MYYFYTWGNYAFLVDFQKANIIRFFFHNKKYDLKGHGKLHMVILENYIQINHLPTDYDKKDRVNAYMYAKYNFKVHRNP